VCYEIYTDIFVAGLDKTMYSLYGISVLVEIWPVHLPTSSNKIHAEARYFLRVIRPFIAYGQNKTWKYYRIYFDIFNFNFILKNKKVQNLFGKLEYKRVLRKPILEVN